ncbi:MAG: nucleotidyltransferase family protein [Candidatus Latescibacteria bacterium]|nr:nucleotidyltransferase family protein [Candidatus Latescibacterota bacterium]
MSSCRVVGILLGIMNNPIYGLVLAAGMARRMGSTKQLLPFGNWTVLQTVVGTLLRADLAGVLVVLGHDAEAVRESFGEQDITFCVNEAYREGMFSSVLCGLAHLPQNADAVLLALGDQPQIDLPVAQAVIAAYQKSDKGIVIPTWDGQRGHPVLVSLARYRAEIFALSGEQGLKPVMRGYPEDTLEVPVDDEGILRDLDTPEDYRAEVERQKAKVKR